jgi:hypothetical protein
VPTLHVLRWCQYYHCHVGEGTAASRTQVVLTNKALAAEPRASQKALLMQL